MQAFYISIRFHLRYETMIYSTNHWFQFSKKKAYDGSETLKMIGNDCLLIEKNFDTMLGSFLKTSETVKLYHFSKLSS